jgi:hypothetical protein
MESPTPRKRASSKKEEHNLTQEELTGISDALDTNQDALGSTDTVDTVASNTTNIQDDILGNIEQQLAVDPTKFNASMVDATPKKLDSLPKVQTNKIIKLFADKSQTTESLAVVGITALVQGGGTNASMPPITRVVNGQKFELKVLRDCVAFVTEKKGTVRQLAKSMKQIIYKIALQNSWIGPLATALKKEYPDIQWDSMDLILAAEFHEDNMDSYMPPKVREALVDRAQKLRTAKLQSQSKPKRKGGKKQKKQR